MRTKLLGFGAAGAVLVAAVVQYLPITSVRAGSPPAAVVSKEGSKAFRAVVKKTLPAVVSISAKAKREVAKAEPRRGLDGEGRPAERRHRRVDRLDPGVERLLSPLNVGDIRRRQPPELLDHLRIGPLERLVNDEPWPWCHDSHPLRDRDSGLGIRGCRRARFRLMPPDPESRIPIP